ncbi:LPS export ABC transporter permease LptG [Aureimonas populi]|uniref:LPS export ABC transporter permease LptG n=1 Tax=Aureimonas populi TaxID=1701758 RepID=A0ABW5CHR8_9HYPH|nr:LPS export ABC transporter permease LptG [Aureimonas populi]
MTRTLSLYFLGRFLLAFLSALVAVAALVYLVDVIEISRRGRFESVGFSTLALISALRVPAFMEQAFPFVVLFAAIFTLISLNRRLELVVARAAGVSIWQILAPFLAGSFLIGVAAATLYNPLAAMAQAGSARIETLIAGEATVQDQERPSWLRQRGDGVDSIIGAKAVADIGRSLGDVTAFVFDDNGNVRERIDAPLATLGDGHWLLENPTVRRVGYPPESRPSMELPTTLLPQYIEQRIGDPATLSIWELGPKIEAARALGLNPDAFAMRLHTLLATPALFMAMTLVAATVAVRFSRLGQSASTIVGGITAGFVLYVVTFLAQALGSNAVVPAVAAAWFPVVAAGLFGTTILLHQEDG